MNICKMHRFIEPLNEYCCLRICVWIPPTTKKKAHHVPNMQSNMKFAKTDAKFPISFSLLAPFVCACMCVMSIKYLSSFFRWRFFCMFNVKITAPIVSMQLNQRVNNSSWLIVDIYPVVFLFPLSPSLTHTDTLSRLKFNSLSTFRFIYFGFYFFYS